MQQNVLWGGLLMKRRRKWDSVEGGNEQTALLWGFCVCDTGIGTQAR
jgi:hypothetical protein